MNPKKNIERFFQLINEDSKSVVEKRKLYSIADKLRGVIGEFKSPTEVFRLLRNLGPMQKEYLHHFGLTNVCKIILIIYFKERGLNELKINKILESIYFSILFFTEGETYEENCDNCGGDGYISCHNCDGEGTISCDECNGDGKVDCENCDGAGQIDGEDCMDCSATGQVDCEECDGEGNGTCSRCDGRGDDVCDDCDGSGNYSTDETKYTLMGYCLWNKDVKNILEIREKQTEPALEDISKSFYQDSIQLIELEEHTELPEEVVSDVYYCAQVSNEPVNFRFYQSFNIDFGDSNQIIKFITD